MYLVEIMKADHMANLSFGETAAIFADYGDAVSYGRSKSRLNGRLIKVSNGDGHGLFYFRDGTEADRYGREKE